MKPTSEHPHSVDPILDDRQRFTNADPNLRPVGALVVVPSPYAPNGEINTHSFLVTAETFPRLHKDFSEMQKKLGGPPYTLVITDALPNYAIAEVYKTIHLIRIRLSAVASVPYKDILQHLGHEHGHIWRELHPDAPASLVNPFIDKRIATELEADLLGVCFTRDKQAALAWNARGGHGTSTEYANKATLAREVIALQWKDCPADAAPPENSAHSSPGTLKSSSSRTP